MEPSLEQFLHVMVTENNCLFVCSHHMSSSVPQSLCYHYLGLAIDNIIKKEKKPSKER